MSREIVDTPVFGPGCFSFGLVVLGGVDVVFTQDFPAAMFHDGEFFVTNEHDADFPAMPGTDA